MDDEQLQEVKRQIEILRAEVADLRGAIKSESANTTRHINSIYRYIADIHDYLMPILHKVFPKYAAAKKEIDAFMEGNGARRSSK